MKGAPQATDVTLQACNSALGSLFRKLPRVETELLQERSVLLVIDLLGKLRKSLLSLRALAFLL